MDFHHVMIRGGRGPSDLVVGSDDVLVVIVGDGIGATTGGIVDVLFVSLDW